VDPFISMGMLGYNLDISIVFRVLIDNVNGVLWRYGKSRNILPTKGFCTTISYDTSFVYVGISRDLSPHILFLRYTSLSRVSDHPGLYLMRYIDIYIIDMLSVIYLCIPLYLMLPTLSSLSLLVLLYESR